MTLNLQFAREMDQNVFFSDHINILCIRLVFQIRVHICILQKEVKLGKMTD